MLGLLLKRFISSAEIAALSLSSVPDVLAADLSAKEVVVRVVCSCINPSDIKNLTAQMPHTMLPRIIGRDYSGVVVRTGADCVQWQGQPVYGTGGELGYLVDGAHAEHIRLPASALCAKPAALSHAEASCVGVNFVTAYSGLHYVGGLSASDTVLITGASGGVGTAVRQLAKLAGATVITVDRTPPTKAPSPSATSADHALYLSDLPNGFDDLHTRIAALPLFASQPADVHTVDSFSAAERRFTPAGRGASLIFDSLGGAFVAPLLRCLASNGRLVNISTKSHELVSIDLHDVYRRQLRLLGANSLYLDSTASAGVLRELTPLFESGALSTAPIGSLVDVRAGQSVGPAYESVAKGARGKVVLVFDAAAAKG